MTSGNSQPSPNIALLTQWNFSEAPETAVWNREQWGTWRSPGNPGGGGRPLESLQAGGLDAPVLGDDEARWGRLPFDRVLGVDLRDRSRGALIGGAIGDARGRGSDVGRFRRAVDKA